MIDKNIGDLLPVAKAQVGAGLIETTSARALHAWLEVGKRFSTWIQDRIATYGFVEGVDFVTEVSPNSGINPSGGRPATEYHLTLDMAKELSMVERNEKGKEARRYFIRCEQVARSSAVGLTAAQVGGIAKAVFRKGLEEFREALHADVLAIVRQEMASLSTPDARFKTSIEFKPALAIVDDAGVPSKGRGPLVRRLSNAMTRYCRVHGIALREEAHTGRRLFPVDACEEFMRAGGRELIRQHMGRLAGQSVIRLVQIEGRP